MAAASKADALVWTGDETQGYLAQGKAVVYTIINEDGKYEVREIHPGVGPAALIAGAKIPKRLCNLYGQRIADPVTPTSGRYTVNYAKLTATLDEAKILAQKDYDKRTTPARRGRS